LTAVVEDTTPQLGGNLDVNGNSIVSVSNGNIAITPNGTGEIQLDGLSWPTADGSANQFLQTDGAGQLSFAEAGGGAWEFISGQSASNDATIDFTSFINDTDFDDYVFIYDNVLPVTDGTDFRMRASIDNGSNFLTTNEYTYVRTTGTAASIVQNSGTGGDRFELANTSLGNAANEGTSGQLFLHKPSATRNTMVHARGVAYDTIGVITRVATGGEIITTSAVNAIRFYMASGNIASGDFRLYGIKKA